MTSEYAMFKFLLEDKKKNFNITTDPNVFLLFFELHYFIWFLCWISNLSFIEWDLGLSHYSDKWFQFCCEDRFGLCPDKQNFNEPYGFKIFSPKISGKVILGIMLVNISNIKRSDFWWFILNVFIQSLPRFVSAL